MIKNKTIVKNDFLNEQYIKIDHSSGLTVYLIEKNMSTSYAILATNFGSMDNVISSDEETIMLPDGIAHFLEHKMFEQPDGSDAFERFSLYGGSANAYTTFDKTCYLFSCTDCLYENLEILLDFVSTPAFNDRSVDKEKGIISQEIVMGNDDPGHVVFNNMLQCMYHNSPIMIDVAGSVESISKIDSKTLFDTYYRFYSPSNMVLCLCGSFEVDKVIELCDKYYSKLENDIPALFVKEKVEEPICIKEKESFQKMLVAQPIFSIGFKGKNFSDPRELMRKSLAISLATKAVFGRSSNFFEKFYSEGLINKSFSVSNYAVRNHLFGVVEGTAKDPKRVYGEVLKEIQKVKIEGLVEDDFKRAKKSLYSNLIMSFDSTEEIANNFISFVFEKDDFFSYIETIIDINIDEAYDAFVELYRDEYSVISIVSDD